MIKQVILFFLITTVVFSQKKEKFNYKKATKRGEFTFFDIVKEKEKEIDSYDLSIRGNNKEKKHFLRWKNYWKDKVDVNGNFPSTSLGYYNAGLLDIKGKTVGSQQALSKKSTQIWVNVGPQDLPDANGYPNYPQLGRLNCFLRIKHATDRSKDILFVGAPNGGIWKSIDGGETWLPKLDYIAGIGVTDIKTTPDATYDNYTTKPIYISTGDYDGLDINSIGVLKSTDGGETFSSTSLTYSLDEREILGDLIVYDDDTVLVGTKSHIKKTVDGGATWTNVFTTNYTNAYIGRVAVNGVEALYTGLFDIFYTSDFINGEWLPVLERDDQNLTAVTLGEDNSFYIQDVDGVIRKMNEDLSFVDIGTTTDYDPQQGYNQALLVNDNIIISGSVGGLSSTDNGSSWYLSLNGYWRNNGSDGSYIHSDHHGLGQLDDDYEFWSVNDGGLSYIDYGTSFTNLKPTITYKSSKVIVTQSYSVAINPSIDDGSYVLGNQDNDAFSKRNGTWYAVAIGDGIQTAINYNNADIRYASDQSGLIIQTSTGFEGELQGNGKSVTVPEAEFYFPLEMNKLDPTILYAGSNEVYKIEDTGSNLTISSLNSGITEVSDIATHGNSILVSSSTELKFSSDLGSTWRSITSPTSGAINSVDFDASNANIMYVTVSSYISGEKVFKTTDGGISFTNISGDLPNIVVKEVLLKQGQITGESLFLATELGVYYTNNSGENWGRLADGLPNVIVNDIEIHYTSDKLVAATYGRGLWEVSIENSTLSNNKEIIDESLFSIYPNPTQNMINISIDENTYNYLIYNVVGGIVKKGELLNKQINISGLKSNIYVLKVFDKEKTYSTKFIKE